MNTGVTAEEVRALAGDTFEAILVKMLGMAEAIVEARANKRIHYTALGCSRSPQMHRCMSSTMLQIS